MKIKNFKKFREELFSNIASIEFENANITIQQYVELQKKFSSI